MAPNLSGVSGNRSDFDPRSNLGSFKQERKGNTMIPEELAYMIEQMVEAGMEEAKAEDLAKSFLRCRARPPQGIDRRHCPQSTRLEINEDICDAV